MICDDYGRLTPAVEAYPGQLRSYQIGVASMRRILIAILGSASVSFIGLLALCRVLLFAK